MLKGSLPAAPSFARGIGSGAMNSWAIAMESSDGISRSISRAVSRAGIEVKISSMDMSWEPVQLVKMIAVIILQWQLP